MNLTAIADRCEQRYRDTGNLSISATDWKAYANDVYMDIVAQRPDWPFMETRSESIVVDAGTGFEPLPTDGWRVSAVYNATNGFPLEQLDGRTQYRYLFPNPGASLGVPQFYRLRANNIEVYPWPSANTTLHIDLFLPPAPLTDSDEPIFPEQYHRILMYGALEYAYQDDGNIQQAQVHKASKDGLLASMLHDLLGTPRGEAYPQIADIG